MLSTGFFLEGEIRVCNPNWQAFNAVHKKDKSEFLLYHFYLMHSRKKFGALAELKEFVG